MRGRHRAEDVERGDVPGWTLITFVSATSTLALTAVAGPWLTALFAEAVTALSAR